MILKGKIAVIIHERHANLKYNYGKWTFGAKGYFASTVGLNQKTIEKYGSPSNYIGGTMKFSEWWLLYFTIKRILA
jgi:hypothetical protein